MNFIEMAQYCYASGVAKRTNWTIPIVFSMECNALLYDIPHLAPSSRKYTPSMLDILANDWEVV